MALLRVYNDIVITVGKGNGSFLDLFVVFDTIDHDNLFYTLEKYVGIGGGSALRLIRSYFCCRTQNVQINGIMSDFASFGVWGATGLSSGANKILFVFASTWGDT